MAESTCRQVYSGIKKATLCIFLLSEEPKTWADAKDYCRDRYTDLASVASMSNMEQLLAAAGGGYQGAVWIGLNDRSWWMWSWSESDSYNEDIMPVGMWYHVELNSSRTIKKLCVAFMDGSWYDMYCSETHTFVCYDNSLNGSAGSMEGYVFVDEALPWHQAQAYCREYHTDLASVRNLTENSQIEAEVPANLSAWIGLHRYTWQYWSDGSSPGFTYWADGHPRDLDKKCVASVMNTTHLGKWMENECTEEFNFMCHNNKKQMFHIKVKSPESTVDLNEPAVTQAIRNMIVAKLKEGGITRDFTTAWIKTPDKNIFHKEDESKT